MQPGAFETEHTRQGRAVLEEAMTMVELRLAQQDQTTDEGRFEAMVCRGQLVVMPAFAAWLCNEREMGRDDAEITTAGSNILANLVCSLIKSTVPASHYPFAIANFMAGLSRFLLVVLIQGEGNEHQAGREYNPNQGRA